MNVTYAWLRACSSINVIDRADQNCDSVAMDTQQWSKDAEQLLALPESFCVGWRWAARETKLLRGDSAHVCFVDYKQNIHGNTHTHTEHRYCVWACLNVGELVGNPCTAHVFLHVCFGLLSWDQVQWQFSSVWHTNMQNTGWFIQATWWKRHASCT